MKIKKIFPNIDNQFIYQRIQSLFKKTWFRIISSALTVIAATLIYLFNFYSPPYEILITNINNVERTRLHSSLHQDMPFLFHCYLNDSQTLKSYQKFLLFLIRNNVHKVVKPWRLFRQPYRIVFFGKLPYSLPPRNVWPNIVPTLRFIKQNIKPVIGDVEVISGFREKHYNLLVGGVAGSRHIYFQALDIVPVKNFCLEDLRPKLMRIYRSNASIQYKLGLGIYSGIKFHVDTLYRKRTWGSYTPAMFSHHLK